MSGKTYLLDTNVILYISNGTLRARDILSQEFTYAISVITYMELLGYNFKNSEDESIIRRLLSYFELIQLDGNIIESVIGIKRERKIKLPDAIIISTAIVKGITLLTADKRLENIANSSVKIVEITS